MTVPFNIFLQIQLFLWGIALGLIFIITFLYLRKFKQSEESRRIYPLSLGLFFLCFFFYIILSIYIDFFLEGGQIGVPFQGFNDNPTVFLFWAAHFSLLAIATIFIIFAVEKEIYTKLKYFLTIFLICCFIAFLIFIFINSDIARYFSWISAVGGIIVPLLYLYVGIKSTGDPRAYALKMFLSLFIISLSHLILTHFFWEFVHAFLNLTPNWEFLDLSQIFLILSPILMIIGTLIIISLERKTDMS